MEGQGANRHREGWHRPRTVSELFLAHLQSGADALAQISTMVRSRICRSLTEIQQRFILFGTPPGEIARRSCPQIPTDLPSA